MEHHLRQGSATLRVQLAPDGDAFSATLADRVHRIAVLATGPRLAAAGGATVEELALEIDGRPRRALVARVRDRILVALDGRVYAFETGEAARGTGHGGAGSNVVTAPMPGKVVAVLVAAGDAVTPGQPLVVLEAMKMESTLAAELEGRVRAVHAVAGALVDAGQVLVELEPAA
jgi:3-methylcrotonyl-CoA carboxylase alpha subunit